MSMMQKAIELKSAVSRLMYSDNKDIRDYNELIDFIESALRPVSREQVEKVWRREWRWVGEDRWSDTYECSKCGKLSMNDYPFCPNCNSAMNDEAVDMVMERLEALKDDQT